MHVTTFLISFLSDQGIKSIGRRAGRIPSGATYEGNFDFTGRCLLFLFYSSLLQSCLVKSTLVYSSLLYSSLLFSSLVLVFKSIYTL
jgi:hypothetical protein